MRTIDLGGVRATVLDAGRIWLDGGAMFGVVPRTLWSREREPDESNRIELAMNVVLLDDGHRRILIDTGAGVDWAEKDRAIYRLGPRSAAELLAPAGVTPRDVDVVVCSHLHFDHAGGNTEHDAGGGRVAAFPEARYVMQRGELEFARNLNERTRASYHADSFEPLLAESDRVEIVDGDHRPCPWLALRIAPGHTPFHQIAVIEGGARTLAFLADLVPTASHLRYPWIMGYDVEPLATLASKKRVLAEAVRERWMVVFQHDARRAVAELIEEGGRIAARAVPAEA